MKIFYPSNCPWLIPQQVRTYFLSEDMLSEKPHLVASSSWMVTERGAIDIFLGHRKGSN